MSYNLVSFDLDNPKPIKIAKGKATDVLIVRMDGWL